jgi:hypothetical protein
MKLPSNSNGGMKAGENAAGEPNPTEIGALKALPPGFKACLENGVLTYFDVAASEPATSWRTKTASLKT